MAFYTAGINRVAEFEELAAAPGYEGEVGAAQIALESIQNDMALFEALLLTDFKEVAMVHESAGEEEITALIEAAGSGLIEKMKEFLKRAWEKIVGLLKSFVANLLNVVIRDNKTFVEKYQTKVMTKELSGLKYKWSECKAGKNEVFAGRMNPEDFKLTEGKTRFDRQTNYKTLFDQSHDDLDRKYEEIQDSKEKELAQLLGLGQVNYNDPAESYKKALYKDQQEYTGLDKGLLKSIIDALTTSKDVLKAFKDAENDAKKIYNERLTNLNRMKEAMAKAAVEDNNQKVDVDGYENPYNRPAALKGNKALKVMYAAIKVEQEVVTKAISAVIKVTKWKIKECRAVFARAAAYNPVKEDAELMDGLDDVAFHELEELFEGSYAY